MKRRDRGQVLVLVALAIFVLLGFAALGIDVGYMYSVRHELQRCADAGALAGASAIKDYGKDCNDSTQNPNGRTTKAEAELRAIDYATRDEVAKYRLNTVAGDIVNAICPDNVTNNPMRVRVDVQRTVPLFFARAIGWDTAPITAFAVAEAFPVSQKVKCVVPWGIPAPWTDTDGDGDYDPGEQVHYPPTAGECDGMSVTEWSYTSHDNNGARSVRDQYLCQGSLQTLKIADPHSQMTPGNFLALDLAALNPICPPGVNVNHGANFMQFMIENSCDCDLGINLGDTLPVVTTEPGNMVGPTLQAVAPDSYFGPPLGYPGHADTDSLMNQDPGAYWGSDNMPHSLNPAWQDANFDKSPRVVRIPIYHPDVTYNGGVNTLAAAGKTSYQPLDFVGFWVQDIIYNKVGSNELGTVVGRYITVGGFGTGTEGEGPAGSPVLNIRLVE